MKYYIAGPMSGYPEFNVPEFKRCKKELEAVIGMDDTIEVPHEIVGEHITESWESNMKRCIRKLVTCDMVLLLDGWENSRGANIEVRLARELGIPACNAIDFFYRLHKTSCIIPDTADLE